MIKYLDKESLSILAGLYLRAQRIENWLEVRENSRLWMKKAIRRSHYNDNFIVHETITKRISNKKKSDYNGHWVKDH